MVKKFRCDLHVHTCLSPCADLGMYPTALVRTAIERHIDVIGICDHNASDNVEYVLRAAEHKPLAVFPGMEVTSREEAHVLVLFGNLQHLKEFQATVYESLTGVNNEDLFGQQAIVNEFDEVEGFNERLLIGATNLSLQEIVSSVRALEGVVIASHIDREYFSVLGQLGFIPPDVAFDALEVTFRTGIREGRRRYPDLASYPFITSSDAHTPDDIGRGVTTVWMETATVGELKMALHGLDGRRVEE